MKRLVPQLIEVEQGSNSSGSAPVGNVTKLQLDDEGVQSFLLERSGKPTFPQRHIIQAARPEAGPEVSKPWCNYAHHGKPDIRSRLVKDKDLDASGRRQAHAGENVLVKVVRREILEVLEPAWSCF